MTHVRLADDESRKKRAERERHAEDGRCHEGDPERDGEHGEREQLARSLPRHDEQQPGHEASSNDDHDHGEHRGLGQGERDRREGIDTAAGRAASGGVAAQERGDGRQQHEDEDRQEVLDDQPTDRDPALWRVELVAVRECAQQHDGARDRERQAEHEPATHAPAKHRTEPYPEQAGHDRLDDRARDGDRSDGQEVAERELDPHAEHEQDDAELGELESDGAVGDEPWRERTDHDAGDDVPDDRGQPDMPGDEPADERGGQADRDGRDENGLVVHGSSRCDGGVRRTGAGPCQNDGG